MINKNFKIILSTEGLSGIGSGFYSIAAMILVLELTGNVFYSGLAFFVTGIAPCAAFLIAPLVNYINYKKGLIYSQLVQAVLLATVPILYFFDHLNIIYLLLIMFIVSMMNQFIYPIQNTIVPYIVGKEKIMKANSMMTFLRESLNIVFYGIAGIVVVMIGASTTFIVTVIIFIVSMFVYTLLSDIQPIQIQEKQLSYKDGIDRYKKDLREGIVFIKDSLLPHFILAAGVANLFCGIMVAVIPAYAISIGGNSFIGFFMMSFTTGILIGSILAPKLNQLPLGIITISTTLLSGVCWIVTPLLLGFSSVIIFGLGFIFLAINNVFIFSAIQTNVESIMIARVTTVLSSFSSLTLPIGSLIGGYLATMTGYAFPIMLGGLGMLFYSVYWSFHPKLRTLPLIAKITFFTSKQIKSNSTSMTNI